MATHERHDGPTPSGGDYSEIYYFDDNNEAVDSSIATWCVIRECKNDGTLLNEIFGRCNGASE